MWHTILTWNSRIVRSNSIMCLCRCCNLQLWQLILTIIGFSLSNKSCWWPFKWRISLDLNGCIWCYIRYSNVFRGSLRLPCKFAAPSLNNIRWRRALCRCLLRRWSWQIQCRSRCQSRRSALHCSHRCKLRARDRNEIKVWKWIWGSAILKQPWYWIIKIKVIICILH